MNIVQHVVNIIEYSTSILAKQNQSCFWTHLTYSKTIQLLVLIN